MKLNKKKVLISIGIGALVGSAVGCGLYFGYLKNRSDFPNIEPLVVTNTDVEEGFIQFMCLDRWNDGWAPLSRSVYISTDGINYSLAENHEFYDRQSSQTNPNKFGVTLEPGEKLYIIRNNPGIIGCNLFHTEFTYSLSGNLGALINGIQELPPLTNEKGYESGYFRNLFAGDTYLIDASELKIPFTKFVNVDEDSTQSSVTNYHLFDQMFAGCYNLEKFPRLPRFYGFSGLAYGMFNSCYKAKIKMKLTDLITPEEENNIFYVCDEYNPNMFSGCSIPYPSGASGSSSDAMPGYSYYII